MNKLFLIIPVIIIVIGLSYFVYTQNISLQDQHYDLDIIGLKNSYHVGDSINYSFTVSGFGNGCGNYVTYVKNDTDRIFGTGLVLDCGIFPSLINYSIPVNDETVDDNTLFVPGIYVAVGEFNQDGGSQFMTEKTFEVIS